MTVFEHIRKHKAEGNHIKAWQTGYAELGKEPNNEYLKTSLFWVIYAALKQVIEPIQKRKNPTPLLKEQKVIDNWVEKIQLLRLSLPNDNIDYRIWNLFKIVGKHCEPLCLFILNSERRLFCESDYEPYIHEKGEAFSNVLRLSRMVAECYLMRNKESSLPVDEVIKLLDYAYSETKDNSKSKVWLEYARAKVFAEIGDMDKAKKSYLSVLKVKRTESWAWFGFGKTFRDDTKKAISIISHGLSYAHEPKFAISSLTLLSKLFSEQGDYELASKTLIRLSNIYKENGWNLKDSIVELMSNEWFDASLDVADLNNQLRILAEGAVEYTVEEPVFYSAVVERVHKSGKGITAYINRFLQIPVQKSLFKDQKLTIPGTFIKILCDKTSEELQAVSIEELVPFESEDVCCFQGKIKITNSGLGFVNDNIFVPPHLVEGITQAAEVAGVAVMSFDEKKQKHGFRAVSLKDLS